MGCFEEIFFSESRISNSPTSKWMKNSERAAKVSPKKSYLTTVKMKLFEFRVIKVFNFWVVKKLKLRFSKSWFTMLSPLEKTWTRLISGVFSEFLIHFEVGLLEMRVSEKRFSSKQSKLRKVVICCNFQNPVKSVQKFFSYLKLAKFIDKN